MVKVVLKPAFLNFDSTEDGNEFEIVGEGKYSMDNVSWSKELVNRMHIPSKLKGVILDWTPWDSDLSKLIKVWGDESASWIGNKVRVTHDNKKLIISPVVLTPEAVKVQ